MSLDYAEVIPRVRGVKSRLVRPEVMKEAAVAESMSEALSLLREAPYPGLSEAKTIAQASQIIWTTYFKTVGKLADLSPSPAREIVRSLLLEEDLRDVLSIYHLAVSGKVVEEKLPSYYLPGSVTRSIYEDPEAFSSPQKIERIAEGAEISIYFQRATSVYAKLKEGPAALWAIPMAVAALYADVAEIDAEELLCPRIEEELFSALLLSKVFGADPRLVESTLPEAPACGLEKRSLLFAYSAEAEPLALAGELRNIMRSIKPEGKSLDEVLLSTRRSARQRILKSSYRIFAGYPFNASFVLAGALLLRMEVENLLYIISSKEHRVSTEKILQGLGFEA